MSLSGSSFHTFFFFGYIYISLFYSLFLPLMWKVFLFLLVELKLQIWSLKGSTSIGDLLNKYRMKKHVYEISIIIDWISARLTWSSFSYLLLFVCLCRTNVPRLRLGLQNLPPGVPRKSSRTVPLQETLKPNWAATFRGMAPSTEQSWMTCLGIASRCRLFDWICKCIYMKRYIHLYLKGLLHVGWCKMSLNFWYGYDN